MEHKKERRKETRISVEIKVSIKAESLSKEITELRTRNISLSGVLLQGQPVFPIGTICHINFYLQTANQTNDDISFRLVSRVVRNDNNEMALEFIEIPPVSFYHLKRIICSNSLLSDFINKEIRLMYGNIPEDF
ncbi:MAG: PilZ domain-containing protein [Candidatus Coatesbacteria bacterium]|nr:PilZ domain-containing protein [Candidatus Coatesbacteria bacterium]